MGAYIEENLLRDERVVYEAHLSRWAFFGPIFWGIVLGPVLVIAVLVLKPYYQADFDKYPVSWKILEAVVAVCVIVAISTLASVWVRYRSTELAVTNRRVIAKFGFMRRETFELNIDRVEGIQVSQGITGRILGFGTLRIAGAGNADPIPNISHPMRFKKAVMESQDEYRNWASGRV